MKQNLDFNLLRKRREQMLKTRKKIELHSEQQLGIAYFENVDGQHYPVIAFFPSSGQSEAAEDKLRYLINGEKR
ncbi:MAG: hypothetical protein ACI4F7_12800 [Acutalibacteraceae bacterium]